MVRGFDAAEIVAKSVRGGNAGPRPGQQRKNFRYFAEIGLETRLQRKNFRYVSRQARPQVKPDGVILE